MSALIGCSFTSVAHRAGRPATLILRSSLLPQLPAPLSTNRRGREHWDKHVNRPVDAWVHDFCAARNAAAHGPSGGEKGNIWPRHNHLIFSAWLLPLIVKKLLAQAAIYKLSAEDKVARAGFEVFLAHDLLAVTEEEGTNVWWQIAESELFQPLLAEQLQQAMRETSGE